MALVKVGGTVVNLDNKALVDSKKVTLETFLLV